MTLTEITEKIEALEEMLYSGVTKTTVDGVSVEFRDLDELTKSLNLLKRERDAKFCKPKRHPYARPTFGGGV